ncbi:MAG TPA: redoxin domain-containing protein [Phototrophicaceae bacterium]|jgi:peroxiredoxin|nr:redoxin domain-containing protein [Phototrophicaceae bacterium]
MAMVFDAFEQGPVINKQAHDFRLSDHSRQVYGLTELIGTHGLLLGFIGDIWQPTSVRRILWLQRHVGKFALMGTPIALLVRDHVQTLHGFHTSSPLPVPFPLLADADGYVHRTYQMEYQAGLVLLDKQRIVRQKWSMTPDFVWPRLNDLLAAVQMLQF